MTPTAHGQDDPDTSSARDHAEVLKTTAIKTVPTIVPVSRQDGASEPTRAKMRSGPVCRGTRDDKQRVDGPKPDDVRS